MSLLDNASLVLTPNAYKESKLYSVIPSNGNGDFTATRATTATRVNADGLVDLVPYNLVQRSEEFDNAAWAIYTGTTKTANVTTAPDGTLTADRIEGTSAAFRGVRQSVTSQIIPHTFSVYLKSATGSNQNARIWIDTTQLTITLTTEWQRFTITATPTTTTFNVIISSPASGGLDLYAWGAQAVEGTSARDYLRTETRLNIPRVDYSLGGCPNILLEPQRTNLVLYSQDFSQTYWSKLNDVVVTGGILSPDGNNNAFNLNFNGTLNGRIEASADTSGDYNQSVWLKTTTGTASVILGTSSVNLQTFIVDDVWRRYDGYFLSGRYPRIRCDQETNIQVWGAQVEAGAYATSYIPTTTASVTRNADVITRNNIYTNGLITAAGGTWFVEVRNNRVIPRDTFSEGIRIINVATGSNNGFEIRNAGGVERLSIIKRLGGVQTALMITTTEIVKIAIKWNGTTADLFVNGVKVVAATAFAFTALDTVSGNGTDVPKYINEMALFPTPLTDAQMSMLTSDIYPTAAAAYASLGFVSESPSCLTSTTTL